MQIRGLYKRYSITGDYTWHIDKRIRRVGRLCENTGTADREEAERYLQRRMSELREIVVFGVRPRRTFREAMTKYLADFASKSTIQRDAEALGDLDPYIGHLCLDQINNDSFTAYRNARQHLSIMTRNAKIGVARRILKLAATVWCYPKTNMTWLDRAPMILLEQGHCACEPYPLDVSEQELLFSELTPERQRLSLFAVSGTASPIRIHIPTRSLTSPIQTRHRFELANGPQTRLGAISRTTRNRGPRGVQKSPAARLAAHVWPTSASSRRQS
jgi:hypothetical protein